MAWLDMHAAIFYSETACLGVSERKFTCDQLCKKKWKIRRPVMRSQDKSR